MIQLHALLLNLPGVSPLPLVAVEYDDQISYAPVGCADRAAFANTVDFFADLLAHGDPRDVGLLWQRMVLAVREYDPAPARDVAAVLSSLDLALWDLSGQCLGLPCYRLLGGCKARRVDCVYTGLTGDQPSALAEQALAVCDQWGSFRLPLPPDTDQALACVQAVRRALGEAPPLMVDLAAACRDREQAAQLGRGLEQWEVFWYQEPLPAGQWDDYALLRQTLGTPLAGGRTALGLKSLSDAIHREAVDILTPDLRLCGGLSGARRLTEAATVQGLRVSLEAGEQPLNWLAAAHLSVASVAAGPIALSLPPGDWRQLYDPAPAFGDGFLLLSEAPGLGLTFRPDLLAEYAVELTPDE
jgi:L-alanine-DL-glutamate epimerase-like enolase superfamily enzyme